MRDIVVLAGSVSLRLDSSDMNGAHLALAISSVLTLSSCAGLSLYGSKSQFEQYTKDSLVRRAGFDLSCSADQLTTRPLGQHSDGYDTVGVEGCGKKTAYILRGGEWIKNAATAP